MPGRVFQSNTFNGVAAGLALVLAVVAAQSLERRTWLNKPQTGQSTAATDARTASDNRHWEYLKDASGWRVPLVHYRRIASASTMIDPVLWELCASSRILAFSARSHEGKNGHRYAHKAQISSKERVENILKLEPDLVLLNSLGQASAIDQLRAAGVTVFDLGPMHGLTTFLPNIVQLGKLLGHPERGSQYAQRFERMMQAVSPSEPTEPSAVYVGLHASRLYGGTLGSSYHDVLRYAGLHDAAQLHFRGWPSYTTEQLLTLNPRFVVTQTGMGAKICGSSALGLLHACQNERGIVEVDPSLLSDPGLGMLESAQLVHSAVFSSPPPKIP